MEDNKKYKYKLWLEVERVEIDEEGDEIGEHEQGPDIGYEPEEMYETDDVEDLIQRRQELVQAAEALK